jgi:nucleotide-binding universal stress UspA family protein
MLGPEVSGMYKKILFPVNDDGSLAPAIPVVAAFAKPGLAEVRVLHAHRVDDRTPAGGGWHLVASVVNRLRDAGVNAVGETRHLYRGERIGAVVARAAVAADSDLVVVGSHGRSDLGALFLGSVSDAVAAGLDAPVLVVRGAIGATEPRTILVGVDGSRAAEDAAAEASELAEAFSASLIVLHVRQLLTSEGAALLESEDEARAILRRAVALAQRPGVEVIPEMAADRSVPEAIVAAARDQHATLVVLGSRRPSHLEGLLLGSVAHRVVHRLHCPVLLASRARRPAPVA